MSDSADRLSSVTLRKNGDSMVVMPAVRDLPHPLRSLREMFQLNHRGYITPAKCNDSSTAPLGIGFRPSNPRP